MPDIVVTLKDGKISVDLPKVKASASAKQKVTWKSHDGDFRIEFKPGSTWPNPITTNTGGVWKAETGPFTAVGTTLRYAVKATGYETLDPDIEIIP
jgi:hypothetical protein